MYGMQSLHPEEAGAAANQTPREAALEARQRKLIADVQSLLATVDGLLSSRGITPAAAAAAPAAMGKHGQVRPGSTDAAAPSARLSATVSASPNNPPLATLAALYMCAEARNLSVQVRQFWHSSLPSRPDEPALSAERNVPRVCLDE